MSDTKTVTVVGAGLAGSEAAWQLARRGYKVTLCEMRPDKSTGAHTTALPAELVCSNSFRGDHISQAPGVLKRELEMADSLIMRCAASVRLPAGHAFALDRQLFSEAVAKELRAEPHISWQYGEVAQLPSEAAIVATGPLTSEALATALQEAGADARLYFYDAVAPIVAWHSLDTSVGWWANRRQEGEGDYFNLPLNKEQYEQFVADLCSAQRVPLHKVEKAVHFEGCLPIEEMADRGPETLRFGPLKPIGLRDPATGHRPWAVVQLRRDSVSGELLNLVGFQTKMTHGEQLRILRTLPGMAQAEFPRLGCMHRNTFLDSPRLLDRQLRLRCLPSVRIGGQLSGVEGYIESAMSGLMAALSLASEMEGQSFCLPPATTASGALLRYITDPEVEKFQPMNINFGLFEQEGMPPRRQLRGRARKIALGERALEHFEQWLASQAVTSKEVV